MSHDEEVLGRAYDHRLMRRLLGYLRPYRGQVAAAAVFVLLDSLVQLAGPYLTKEAIDNGIRHRDLAHLDRVAILYLAMLAVGLGVGYLNNQIIQRVGQHVMLDLRLALFRKLQRLPIAYYDRTPIGRLMTRITSDVEALNEMFASGLVSLVGDVIRLSAILVAIFGIDWKLALFSMGSAPVLFAIAAIFRRLVRDAFREIRTKMARLNAFLQEHISGMKVVQAFAQEERVGAQLDVINRDYRRANARAIGADSALYSIIEAVASIAIAGLLWHGGARIAGGTLTFGVLVAFIEYLTKFFGPIRDLSAKYTIMQQAMAAAERVFGLLDTAEPDAPPRAPSSDPAGVGVSVGVGVRDPLPSSSTAPAGPAPLLALDRVSFGYRPGHPVLDQVSLPIRSGETIAVVGATGSGKSTLIKLLPRLYEPWSGSIRLAGTDVRDLDPSALRRRIVVVSQDVFLFAGTLGDNISLGDARLSREAILAAARRVGADRVIARRPEGLDAPVIERGANFSAGERQLIAFARALCRDPEILILDEATASVDPETERLIERGTEELMRGRTSIVIAHRLSTIRRATRILALHRGRVAEEGSHEELLARDGIYARLYRLQMMGGADMPAVPGPASGAAG